MRNDLVIGQFQQKRLVTAHVSSYHIVVVNLEAVEIGFRFIHCVCCDTAF
jgi:hypothetical protein